MIKDPFTLGQITEALGQTWFWLYLSGIYMLRMKTIIKNTESFKIKEPIICH